MTDEEPATILTCEHASFGLPQGVDLGVDPRARRTHVGWDPGAGEVAEGLKERLMAPLFTGSYSRLFVDLNRSEENPAVIPVRSFEVEIPGNRGLTPAEREGRMAGFHRPYREEIRREIERRAAEGRGVLHLSIHSFDPGLDPEHRAFDVGVLFDPERAPEARHARALVETLTSLGLDTRENEPYAGTDDGLSTWLRGIFEPRLYSGIEIELSQALVLAEGGVARAVESLARALSRGESSDLRRGLRRGPDGR